jgi:beta-aspartyl-peptidase (threonine type)
VCAVRRLKNPIVAARAVMERSGCVLLAGDAADDFGRREGLAIVDNAHFTTERRVQALKKLQAAGQRGTFGATAAAAPVRAPGITEADRHGTVGAVALDAAGHLAAATSTGGFNNKPVGRVGDSPIIGAGTYARDGTCAVSCTGQGEIFMRHVVAHEIAARMRHGGASLEEATRALMDEHIAPHRIGAGLVALDAAGGIAAPFNTLGMARGWIAGDGRLQVATHARLFDLGAP